MATPPKFGLMLPPFSWPLASQAAEAAEQQGFDSVWLPDHMLNPMAVGDAPQWDTMEAWTALAVLAGRTRRLRFGFMMLNPAFRNPAVLAKMAATFDQCSGGRLIFSLGAGYLEREYRTYDLPWDPEPPDRLGRARETALLARELWARPHEEVTWEGDYVYAYDCHLGVDCHQRPHPPIWFGGDSLPSRLVMDEVCGEGPAGGWFMHPQLLDENLEWFCGESAHAGEEGFALATYLVTHVGPTSQQAAETARTFVPVHPRYERDFDDTLRHQAIGTVDDVVEKVRAVLDKGINYVVFVADPFTQATLAEEILPALSRVPVA